MPESAPYRAAQLPALICKRGVDPKQFPLRSFHSSPTLAERIANKVEVFELEPLRRKSFCRRPL